jgi:hypothetical protein
MQLTCPSCRRVLNFEDEPPRFCAHCGQPLSHRPRTAEPGSEATTPPLEPPAQTAVAQDEPQTIGGYRLLRPLGEGGMGTVYEAEDPTSGRRVALKLIHPDFATPEAVARFRREGRLASALVHPRCVFVFAADEQAGQPYIVMELMPGDTLEDLVRRRGPLPVPEAVAKIHDAIEGLQEAHDLGLIHRDVKPSNCFLEADGRVKIGDFGLAKARAGGTHLTKTGSFLGTPLYASPEQVRADRLDVQTDVYSVAATLYFLLTEQAPFQGGDAAATLARIVADDPPPLRGVRPDVSEELERVVLRGLARSRERRYQDLEEFRQALRPFLPGKSLFATLGRRFAAFLVDCTVLTCFGCFGVIFLVAILPALLPRVGTASDKTHLLQFAALFAYFLYYTPEGIWGYSLGKGALGLRVCRATNTDPPGFWRGLLRTAIFFALFPCGSLTALMFLPTPPWQPGGLPSGAAVMIWPLGLFLVCCTMRPRNGLRGLHDFATGTRVLRRPRPEQRLGVRGRTLQQPSQPSELPEHIGPYRVRGALQWGPKVSKLLGEDLSLGRDVLLWLRPPSGPPFSPERRDLGRTTRLRWLACGTHGGQQWDAFLAPSGCSLPALVAADGPLGWPDTRYLLEQLARELLLAADEGTLPWSLGPDQVWVQASGRVLLLDAPLTSPVGPTDPSVHPVPARERKDARRPAAALSPQEQEQRLCLTLLRDVAALAVRGRPGTFPRGRAGPGAPLPLYAVELLHRFRGGKDRYHDVAEFHAALRTTRTRPAEATRPRRAAHLLLQAAEVSLLFVGYLGLFGCCSTPFMDTEFGKEVRTAHLSLAKQLTGQSPEASDQEWPTIDRLAQHLGEVERGASRTFLLSALSPDPKAKLTAVAVWVEDMRLRDELRHRLEPKVAKWEARQGAIGPLMRPLVERDRAGRHWGWPWQGHPLAAAPNFRQSARSYLESTSAPERFEMGRLMAASLVLTSWLALWLLWVFLGCGGPSFAYAGLALVRRDGRPAPRWRCAWRALLMLAPVTALLVGSIWLDGWHWFTWAPGDPYCWAAGLSRASWWAGFLLLGVYVGLALWSPARGLHDRLADTFLVPR